jgi:hypothetical protein
MTKLRTYTIYRNALDHPGKYVVRGFTIYAGAERPDTEPLAVVDTLDEARDAIPASASVRFGRADADGPQIVETWM